MSDTLSRLRRTHPAWVWHAYRLGAVQCYGAQITPEIGIVVRLDDRDGRYRACVIYRGIRGYARTADDASHAVEASRIDARRLHPLLAAPQQGRTEAA